MTATAQTIGDPRVTLEVVSVTHDVLLDGVRVGAVLEGRAHHGNYFAVRALTQDPYTCEGLDYHDTLDAAVAAVVVAVEAARAESGQ